LYGNFLVLFFQTKKDKLMPLFLSIVYLLIAVYGTKRLSNSHTNFGTFSIFSIFAFVYYVTIPLELYLTNNVKIYKGSIIDYSDQIFILTLSILALIGFYYGIKISKFSPISRTPSSENLIKKWKGGWFLIIVFPLLILTFFNDEIALSGTYVGNYTTIYNNPIYSLLLEYTYISISVFNGILILKNKRIKIINLFICFVIVFWGIYSSNKDPIVISLAPFLLYFTFKPPKKAYLFLFYFLILVLFIVCFLMLFTVFRKELNFSYDVIESIINEFGIFRYTDPAGPMHVFSELVINNDNFEFQLGKTYLSFFYIWIPKFIWPGRWLDPAQEFAQNNITNWISGQGMGYSLLGESYLNFGFFGAFIQYFIIGYLWGKIWNFIKNRFIKINYNLWLSIYYVFGVYILLVMHRAFTSAIFKQLILIVIPLTIISVFFDKIVVRLK
tara:strand:- start:1667 stop:2992 length:1326 start_codon:yes stop_codon:yes gene_type:complete